MTRLALIRHGVTQWNLDKRLQGRTDTDLLPQEIEDLKGLSPGEDLLTWQWISSPLKRALDTARILGKAEPATEDALIEMSWGVWEGRTLADLRAELGDAMKNNEDGGLDFRPEGGESPRGAQDRMKPLLAKIAAGDRPTVCVTHVGVMRAVMALAYNWDMLGKPPVKFDRHAIHFFEVTAGGSITAVEMNVPFEQRRI